MNQIINKLLLAGDKCIPEMYFRQPRFTYSVWGPFIKNKKRIQKFKEIGDWKCIYQNRQDKSCFQQDIAHGYFKDLSKRTIADKTLCHKAFNFLKNSKYEGYKGGLPSIVYKVFDKNICNANKGTEINSGLVSENK